MTNVSEWFAIGLAKPGKNKVGLAKALGVNPSVVSRMIAGKRPIKIWEINTICAYLEMEAPDFDNLPRTPSKRDPGIIEVEARAGAGLGFAPYEEGLVFTADFETYAQDFAKGVWRMPDRYLAQEIGIEVENARIIEIQGDSMAPTLMSGDRVMVNIKDRRPSPPGLFVLWDGVGISAKRLELMPRGNLSVMNIISDNPLHANYERTIDEVSIIGRIVWVCRKL